MTTACSDDLHTTGRGLTVAQLVRDPVDTPFDEHLSGGRA
jgi:hypothetical protein